MSDPVQGWLDAREPPAPEAMASWLQVEEAPGTTREALTSSAVAALDRARAVPGRVRQSALHLLRADALLTYACEAALEEADPEGSLRRILAAVGASRS